MQVFKMLTIMPTLRLLVPDAVMWRVGGRWRLLRGGWLWRRWL